VVHTIIVVAAGLVLLAASGLVGRLLNGSAGLATAALVFLPLWMLGAGINMYIGVKRAGYSVAEEAPIFLLVYGLPAAAALLLWWKSR
jgi:hypothetical protein